MPRPNGDIHWATDANYSAPGETWDGDPTKVEPPIGLKDAGHQPTGVFPIEMHNWWRNRMAQFTEYLADLQVWNWNNYTAAFGPGLNYFISQRTAAALGTSGPERFYICDPTGGAPARLAYSDRLGLNGSWVPCTGIAGTALVDVVRELINSSVLPDQFLVGGSLPGPAPALWASIPGIAFSIVTFTPPAGAQTVFDIHHSRVAGLDGWIVSYTGTSQVTYNIGAGWLTGTMAGGTVGAYLQSNGSRLVGGHDVGLEYSTDGGLSWTATQAVPGGVSGVYFAPGIGTTGRFLASGIDGGANNALWTSDDGIAWLQQPDPSIAALPSPIQFRNGSARNGNCDGGQMIIGEVLDAANGIDYYVFSTDGGVTWQTGPVVGVDQRDFGVIGYSNNRFWSNAADAFMHQSAALP